MQDSGADGTAPAFDSTSELSSLPPSPGITPLSQPILSAPQMHIHCPLVAGQGNLPKWGIGPIGSAVTGPGFLSW